VRPATPTDGSAIAELAVLAGGSGWWGVEQRTGPDRPEQARFVEVEGDALVGYGCIWRRREAIFGLDTLVDPARRGRGIGRALLERLFEELAARGATAVEARVDADHLEALRFLLRRGFTELNRLERVRLDLAGVEIAEPAPPGIAIAALSEARDPDLGRALHELMTAAFRERTVRYLEPFVETPIERFEAELAESIPDGSFIARSAGAVVGFTGVIPGPEPATLTAHMTAVHPDHSRRGIATALKLRAIAFAKRSGHRAIYTSSPNRAMQALNEKLGFVRYAPTEIRMGRRF
jgi:GNAT superfamily N-acetyltransferase